MKGWQEFGGTWKACDYKIENLRSVLTSNEISIGEEVFQFNIEFQYKISSCDSLPQSPAFCKENLTMHIIEYAEEKSKKAYFVNSFQSTNDQWDSEHLLHHVRQPKNLKSIQLQFTHYGSCVEIKDIQVYFNFCPSSNIKLTKFPRTVAPVKAFQKVEGSCISYAKALTPPTYLCQTNGKWFAFKEKCKCKAGYEESESLCKKCPQNYYKQNLGNAKCSRCPKNSNSRKDSVYCDCKHGYARSPKDSSSVDCGGVLPKPVELFRDFRAVAKRGGVELKWRPVSRDSAGRRVWYVIQCESCSEFTPITTEHPNLTINGLAPNTEYAFLLTAENVLTDVFKSFRSPPKLNKARTAVVTLEALKVDDVHATKINFNSIRLQWIPLIGHYQYHVKVYRDGITYMDLNTNSTRKDFFNLQAGIYKFGVNVVGESFVTTSQEIKLSGSQLTEAQIQHVTATVGIISLIFVVLISLFFSVLCYFRRKKEYYNWGGDRLVEMSHDAYQRYNTVPSNGAKLLCGENFVEPIYAYETNEEMYIECTQPIKRSCITVNDKAITGGFGVSIHSGLLDCGSDDVKSVSIKVLHDNANDVMRKNFAVEAAILSQFRHPNVVLIYGVVWQEMPYLMVTEQVENGALNILLRDTANNSANVSSVQLAHILRGVACGMQYLAGEGYVHKVLNAANILVSSSFMCKISGFDMRASLDIDLQVDNWKSEIQEALAPWAAPEVIELNKHSLFSDVWAFGSVMWEVFSLGGRPYFDWNRKEINRMLDSGYRLPPPDGCPEMIYELMMQCWILEPHKRPHFHIIRECLESYIRKPLNGQRPKQNLPDFLLPQAQVKFPALKDWLKSLKLAQYTEQFEMAGFCHVEDFLRLDNQTLKMLNISQSRHRKKLLGAIDALNDELVNRSYGSPVHTLM